MQSNSPASAAATHLQPLARRQGLARFAEWWPAALIGLVALLGAVPESNAQTILSLF